MILKQPIHFFRSTETSNIPCKIPFLAKLSLSHFLFFAFSFIFLNNRKTECPLITFDLPYLAFYYNQRLMLYQISDDINEIVGKMKDGLATVLEEFYQLAGKLGKDEEGIFRFKHDEDDSDASPGVEVLEAMALILELMRCWLRKGQLGS